MKYPKFEGGMEYPSEITEPIDGIIEILFSWPFVVVVVCLTIVVWILLSAVVRMGGLSVKLEGDMKWRQLRWFEILISAIISVIVIVGLTIWLAIVTY